MMKHALWQGVVAGAAGATVMTLDEKLEQRLTGQPDSHVLARVLERLTGIKEHRHRQPLLVNWATV